MSKDTTFIHDGYGNICHFFTAKAFIGNNQYGGASAVWEVIEWELDIYGGETSAQVVSILQGDYQEIIEMIEGKSKDDGFALIYDSKSPAHTKHGGFSVVRVPIAEISKYLQVHRFIQANVVV